MRLQSLRVSDVVRFWIGRYEVYTHKELREDDSQIMDAKNRSSRNTG